MTASDSSSINYPIRSGETLSQITRDHNYRYATDYTVEEIAALNGISNPDLIYAGDTLKLPVPTTSPYVSSGSIGGLGIPASLSEKQELETNSETENIQVGRHASGKNIAIGVGEIVLGVSVWVVSIAGAAFYTIGTEGVGIYNAGIALSNGLTGGAFFVGDGLARITGVYDEPIIEDIVSTTMPIEKEIADNIRILSEK